MSLLPSILQEQLEAVEATNADKTNYGTIASVGLGLAVGLGALVKLWPGGVVPTTVVVTYLIASAVLTTVLVGVLPLFKLAYKNGLKRQAATNAQALEKLKMESENGLKLKQMELDAAATYVEAGELGGKKIYTQK